ncbi:transposable element Tcb2 transposase [Trichonephila clavipes]|nr:transposable element Tcb2 transposase [Trichonephila clavipes]
MEAGWSPWRVPRQLGHSDCVLRRCLDQWIREMSFTRRPDPGRPRQTSLRKYRHIVRSSHVQLTASSATIQVRVASSLGAPVSSGTMRRLLAEGHLGSRHPLRVLPLKPSHRHIWSGATQEETGLQWNGTGWSLATNPDSISSSDNNHVRVWRPRVERLNPAFALQQHTAPIAGVMVWGTIAYNTRSPLILIRGTMTSQPYVHDILQPHVLPLMSRLPGAIFQQDNVRPHTAKVSQDYLQTVTVLRFPARSEHI